MTIPVVGQECVASYVSAIHLAVYQTHFSYYKRLNLNRNNLEMGPGRGVASE